MNNQKKLSLIFLLALILLIIPLSSAVTLDSGTVLNTTGSNSSLTFVGCSATLDEVVIRTVEINLYSLTTSESQSLYIFPSFINYTTPNKNVDCSDFDITFGIPAPNTVGGVCSQLASSLTSFATWIAVIVTVLVAGSVLSILLMGKMDFNGNEIIAGIIAIILFGIVSAIGVVTLKTLAGGIC